ncbi:MAG: hypothetical protein J7599_07465 [Niabella sp.]|nr:hypothetical protein [Niabella sp.]
MAELLGKNFMMYAVIEGVQKPIACATSMAITITADMKEATKPPDSRWRSYYAGMLGYSASVDGLFVIDSDVVSADEFIDNIIEGSELQWIATDIVNPSVLYSGYVLQNTISITSPAEGFHTFSASFTGTGALTKTSPSGKSYLLTEDGWRLLKEDGSGFLLTE